MQDDANFLHIRYIWANPTPSNQVAGENHELGATPTLHNSNKKGKWKTILFEHINCSMEIAKVKKKALFLKIMLHLAKSLL